MERVADIMEENGIEILTKLGLYGLVHKEKVDDLRESSAL